MEIGSERFTNMMRTPWMTILSMFAATPAPIPAMDVAWACNSEAPSLIHASPDETEGVLPMRDLQYFLVGLSHFSATPWKPPSSE
jgi:hypothetical protein